MHRAAGWHAARKGRVKALEELGFVWNAFQNAFGVAWPNSRSTLKSRARTRAAALHGVVGIQARGTCSGRRQGMQGWPAQRAAGRGTGRARVRVGRAALAPEGVGTWAWIAPVRIQAAKASRRAFPASSATQQSAGAEAAALLRHRSAARWEQSLALEARNLQPVARTWVLA